MTCHLPQKNIKQSRDSKTSPQTHKTKAYLDVQKNAGLGNDDVAGGSLLLLLGVVGSDTLGLDALSLLVDLVVTEEINLCGTNTGSQESASVKRERTSIAKT